MRKRYLDLMEKALSAYPDAHILRYFEDVKQNGLSEHGFPRLTANIGILIAHGRRADLLPLFLEMMDFCCHQIPRVQAANDFSVREIVNAIAALENAQILPPARIDAWRQELAAIDPYTCYSRIAGSPDEERFNNLVLFTAVSEYRRLVAGLGGDMDVIDTQIATQLWRLDENGMYRDHASHAPMVYDLVARGLFATLLSLGYDGKYRDMLDQIIRNAALLSLKMQSVTGELPFGGRSNQFMHNEAWQAAVFEYEAKRYEKMGDLALAGTFKAACVRALDNIEIWFSKQPIHHVKNRFLLETSYGCENYAYFDKYMITAASFLHEAYLICDERIAPSQAAPATVAWQTSEYFHAAFLRAGGYALQFDTAADSKYEATGLGRVHRAGAPSAICLSVPCPATPNFTVDLPPRPLSLCAGVRGEGGWHFVCDGEATYALSEHRTEKEAATATVAASFEGGKQVSEHYTVSERGVEIALSGTGEIAYLLPAFDFDGEAHTEIRAEKNTLCITYQGWVCRYVTDGEIVDLGYTAPNRNGHYRAFAATGKDALRVKIEIFKQDEAT